MNKLLVRAGVVDVPNERSSHVRTTIRGGGAAQLLALLVGGSIAAVGLKDPDRLLVLMALGSACAVGVLGMAEDAKGVSIKVRAGVQLIVGSVLGVLATQVLGSSWWWLPAMAVAFAAYVNFANFMDGINGISGLHGFVVGSTYAFLGFILELPWLVASGALVAVAFLAFLPWNFTPPGVFLGDVGSYLLGGAIAGIAVLAVVSGAPMLAVVAPVSIYLADTVTAVARRVLKGERWFEPHRGHVYQRLVDGGQSHVKIAVAVALFSLAAGAVGLASAAGIVTVPAAAWVIVLALVAIYLGMPRLARFTSREGAKA
ncbi:glycosyltransferase family 4 protein [Tessaracoccus rhinocerotis]|uniref:Glycosyltransferase family 4 protein n=1 Tax=Tessaracoccus rhinocerotis TaxID=1689449 RepID=A0A553K0X5_9ACTN|nr:glycosyltransferase family 4 protein [Tessaracoccus rhinocerotis]TRY18360.1 glycosyltransferase family 4 protein [Tessaracoccus rhinocerotis]